MDLDDLLPQKKPTGVIIGGNLETLSLGELETRVKDLETEILRVRAEIDRKKRYEEAARALFKSLRTSKEPVSNSMGVVRFRDLEKRHCTHHFLRRDRGARLCT